MMNNQDNACKCIRCSSQSDENNQSEKENDKNVNSSRSSNKSGEKNQSESGNDKNVNSSPSSSKSEKNQSESGNNKNVNSSRSSKKSCMAGSEGKISAKQVTSVLGTNRHGTSREYGKGYHQDDNRKDIKFQVMHKNPLFPRD